MNAQPDMARGTTSTALSMTTGVRRYETGPVSTPLGARWEIRSVMFSGGGKCVALCRGEAEAREATALLNIGAGALRDAASVLAGDRNG